MPVWLEYVQYSIGGLAEEGGLAAIRDTFERALTAVGIHVTSGSMLWEAYREFECAMLAGLQPTPGSVADADTVKQIDTQTKRVAKLFQRQLSIPLMGWFHLYLLRIIFRFVVNGEDKSLTLIKINLNYWY